MNTLITTCLWLSGIVAGIAVFMALLFYAAYVISSPIPPRVPLVMQIIILPFCYIVMIAICVTSKDWQTLKNIRKWQF